jgi:hypothetical protein
MSAVKYAKRFVNKNPRNMEMMRLLRKPDGWDFEKNKERKNFIYRFLKIFNFLKSKKLFFRVDFTASKNSTTASIVHFAKCQTVIEASTNEKSVRNQLYRFILKENFF